MGERNQRHTLTALPQGNSSSIFRGRGWMGSRADLNEYGEEKISSFAPPEFEPRTAQSIPSRYTDHATSSSNNFVYVSPTFH